MPKAHPDLAALIGSRICHDLISPIGAINNGLELLNMSGGAPGPELGLIGDSVENASARIRFFRLAFGAAGQQEVSASEIRGILNDTTKASKMRPDWTIDTAVERRDVRLSFLALQCMETAMPWGGAVSVERLGQDWSILAQADKFSVKQDLWSLLADGSPGSSLAPAEVQFALLPLHCRTEGRRLSTHISDTDIRIVFSS